jgi:pimeloyl-ACP methyl ester carboxylesterase
MPRTSAAGIAIAYDRIGSGEPALLCLPGWCENRTVFAHVAQACGKNRLVLALDWRGHGESDKPNGDFSADDLVEDAVAVIEAGGARTIIPVAVSHAGWIALELRRRLGDRIPRIILLDWIVLDPPPPFAAVLEGVQDPDRWAETREQLFAMWMGGSADHEVRQHIFGEMGAYDFEMWARAGREIGADYQAEGNPLKVLGNLTPPIPVLHLYSQPRDDAYLEAQRSFARSHPWFTPRRIDGATHFPTLETPGQVIAAIEDFLA